MVNLVCLIAMSIILKKLSLTLLIFQSGSLNLLRGLRYLYLLDLLTLRVTRLTLGLEGGLTLEKGVGRLVT